MEEHEKKVLQDMLDSQTEKIFLRIGDIENTLAPIAAIYDSTKGFNSVIKFIFKSIIIPLSIIIGIIISLKGILFGGHK